jgi:hypothetical protein
MREIEVNSNSYCLKWISRISHIHMECPVSNELTTYANNHCMYTPSNRFILWTYSISKSKQSKTCRKILYIVIDWLSIRVRYNYHWSSQQASIIVLSKSVSSFTTIQWLDTEQKYLSIIAISYDRISWVTMMWKTSFYFNIASNCTTFTRIVSIQRNRNES